MLNVWGRRAAGAAAMLLWAIAIAAFLAGLYGHPGTDTVMLCTLAAVAAAALTVCAWLEHLVTPLITSHILGIGAGFRTGLRVSSRGRHQRVSDGRVVPLFGRDRAPAGHVKESGPG